MPHRSPILLLALLAAASACSDSDTGPEPPELLPGLFLAPVDSGLDFPIYVAAPPGDTRRLFIVERPGRIVLRKDGRPHPFQITMRRFGRKLDVAAMRETLPLNVYFFDCLYLDGNPTIDRGQDERFAALAASLPQALVVPRLVTSDAGGATPSSKPRSNAVTKG